MGDLVPLFRFSSGGISFEVLGLGRRRTSHSHLGFVAGGLLEDEVALGGVPNCCVGSVDGIAGLYGAPGV
jgi:hypothetical protein